MAMQKRYVTDTINCEIEHIILEVGNKFKNIKKMRQSL